MWETRFNPWVGKILWRRKWQPTPVLLPGKSHRWRSMVGYSPWGHKKSDTTEQLHSLTHWTHSGSWALVSAPFWPTSELSPELSILISKHLMGSSTWQNSKIFKPNTSKIKFMTIPQTCLPAFSVLVPESILLETPASIFTFLLVQTSKHLLNNTKLCSSSELFITNGRIPTQIKQEKETY